MKNDDREDSSGENFELVCDLQARGKSSKWDFMGKVYMYMYVVYLAANYVCRSSVV